MDKAKSEAQVTGTEFTTAFIIDLKLLKNKKLGGNYT